MNSQKKTHFKAIFIACYYINMKVDCNEDKEEDLTKYSINAYVSTKPMYEIRGKVFSNESCKALQTYELA